MYVSELIAGVNMQMNWWTFSETVYFFNAIMCNFIALTPQK